jgi:hypothetical protein
VRRFGVGAVVDLAHELLAPRDDRRAASPETLVVRPAEQRRDARVRRDPRGGGVGVADGLEHDGAGLGVRPQPVDRGRVAGSGTFEVAKTVEPERSRSTLPERRDRGGGVTEPRQDRDREQRHADRAGRPEAAENGEHGRPGEREVDPRLEVELEDGVHPMEIGSVRITEEDDLAGADRRRREADERRHRAELAIAFGVEKQRDRPGDDERREREQRAPPRDRDHDGGGGEHGDQQMTEVARLREKRDSELRDHHRGRDREGTEDDERVEERGLRVNATDAGDRCLEVESEGERRDEDERGDRGAGDRDAGEGTQRRVRRGSAPQCDREQQRERERRVPRVRERERGEEASGGGERRRRQPCRDRAGRALRRAEQDADEGHEDDEPAHVGMQVAVKDREERKLRDRVRDDPRRPPVVELGERCALEHDLSRAVEVAEQDRAGASEQAERPARRRRVPDRSAAREDDRSDRREREVVGDLRRDPGEAGEVREQEMAEVVVVDRMAGEPRILRRDRGRADDRVEEREVHELLRAEDLRTERAHEREEEERRREPELAEDELAPRRPLADALPGVGERRDAERGDGEHERRPVGEAERRRDPGDEADPDDRQRTSERRTAIRELREEAGQHRRDRGPEDREQHPPENEIHVGRGEPSTERPAGLQSPTRLLSSGIGC